MYNKVYIIFFISIVFIISSCENNIEVIRNMGKEKDLPQVSADNIEILYSDSARVKIQIISPSIVRYNLPNKMYTEFSKGLTVNQYDTAHNIEATITAQHAVYRDQEKLWKAWGNVLARNHKSGEELSTEELFWNQEKGIIYSTKFSRISNADGVFYGDGGFEAKEDMSQWHMIGIKGSVNIKDNGNEN